MSAMPSQGRKGSESLSSKRSRRATTNDTDDTDSHHRSDAGKCNASSEQIGQVHGHANGGEKHITVKTTKAKSRVTMKTGTSREVPGPQASSKSSRDSVTSKGTAETTKHSVDNGNPRTSNSHNTKTGRTASHSKKSRKRTKPSRLNVGGKIDAKHTGHWDLLAAQPAFRIADVYTSLSQDAARTASPSRTRELAQRALRSDAFGIYTWIVAVVKFGDNPGLEVDLVVDTGSGLTHVDEKLVRDCCDDSLKQSKIQPERYVKENFGTDPVSTEGPLYKTTITVGNTKKVEIKEQMFFVAKNAKYNGVLGLGPRSLTKGTIVDHPEETVSTVLENLIGHDDLDKGGLGLHILPFPTGGDGTSFTGYLDFGGVDESSFTRNMVYIDMTETGLTADYYGLEAKLTYGGSGLYIIGSRGKSNSLPGVIDSGALGIQLLKPTFEKLVLAMLQTDVVVEAPGQGGSSNYWTIKEEHLLNLQDMTFHFLDKYMEKWTKFTIPAHGLVFPPEIREVMGVKEGWLALTVRECPIQLELLLGTSFLQRFYAMFDISNRVIGIAQTRYTSYMSTDLIEMYARLLSQKTDVCQITSPGSISGSRS